MELESLPEVRRLFLLSLETQSLMSTRRILVIIMLAVLAWGIFHAVGAYRFNHNPWRAVMVLGCSATFLGIWIVLLSWRQAKVDDRDRP